MRKFTKNLKSFALCAVALVSAVACNSKPEPETPPTPTVELAEVVSIVASETTTNSATLTFNFKNAVELYYAIYPSALNNDGPWIKKEVTIDATTLSVNIGDLNANVEYEVMAYALNSEGKESQKKQITFTTVAAPTIEILADPVIEQTSATFTVAIDNGDTFFYACHPANQTFETMPWEEGTMAEPTLIELTSLTSGVEYELTVKAVNTAGNVESAEVSTTFTTLKDVLTVSNESVKALAISVDVEFDNTKADAFGYLIEQSYVSMDEFKFRLTDPYGGISKSSAADTTLTQSMLNPSTEYKLFLAALTDNGDGTYAIVGEAAEYSYTTPAVTIGESSETLSIVVDAANITVNSAKAVVTKGSENVMAFYYGHVESSVLGSQTITDYITSGNRLNGKYPEPFYLSSWGGEVTYIDDVEISLSDLMTATEYTFYALAIDANGEVSVPFTQSFSTKDIVYNETLTMDALIASVGLTTASIDFWFTPEITKLVHLRSDATEIAGREGFFYTPEEALSKLIAQTTDNWSGVMSDNSKVVDGVYRLNEEWLSENSSYIIYYLAVDTEGQPTKMQTVEFTTNKIEFLSSCTATVSYVSHVLGSGGYSADVTLDVVLADGATEFIMSVERASAISDIEDVYSWGRAALLNPRNKRHVGNQAVNHVDKVWSDSDMRYVIVPIDADGNYGVPVVYQFDQW